MFDLEWNFGIFEKVADGIALSRVVACPYFLQTFIGQIGSRNGTMTGSGKVLHQIHITIGATRESGTVSGSALGTNHKGVEFTIELGFNEHFQGIAVISVSSCECRNALTARDLSSVSPSARYIKTVR